MSALALSWHEDASPRDLVRWAIAGLIVVGVHAGVIAYFLATHEPDEIGEYSDVMSVELAPIDSTPDAAEQDVAPAPETMVESQPVPDLPNEKPPDEITVEQPPDEALTLFPTPLENSPRRWTIRRHLRHAPRNRSRAALRRSIPHGRQVSSGNCSASSATRPKPNRATSRASYF
jgi:hypothetical protein